MVSLKRILEIFSRQTRDGNRLNDMQKRTIEVLSRYKHAKADVVGSSSGKGIQESGYILPYLLILSNHVPCKTNISRLHQIHGFGPLRFNYTRIVPIEA